MGARYRTEDGCTVEAIRLICTPDKHDGEWLRACRFGYHIAAVRSVAEVERLVPLAQVERDALTLAA